MNNTPELPPPPDVVWAAIVGDIRSGWWATRRLYSDDGRPLTRRQARAVPAAAAGPGMDGGGQA